MYDCYHLWQVYIVLESCYTIEIAPVENITEDIDYSGAEKSDIYDGIVDAPNEKRQIVKILSIPLSVKMVSLGGGPLHLMHIFCLIFNIQAKALPKR